MATLNEFQFTFHKLDGAGNDFVGIDWRGRQLPGPESLASMVRVLCHRHHGIGADGVILIQDAPLGTEHHFAMKYLNADGSVGSMCGNGARCASVFAHFLGAAPSSMRFLTDAGNYRADVDGDHARVHFPPVRSLPQVRQLQGGDWAGREADFLLVGVPHAVFFVENLADVDVFHVGREVRNDPVFAPAGTNANFVRERNGVLQLRTYERGVEDETLACGTGSVASACCHAARLGLTGKQAIIVLPTGGIPLKIEFEATESGFENVVLGGSARIVFSGETRVRLAEGGGGALQLVR